MNWKIWLLIFAIGFSLLAIRPNFETGVLIKSVELNSSAFEQGLRQGQIIKQINDIEIKNVEDYSKIITELFKDQQKKRIDITTKTNSFVLFISEPPKITISDLPNTRIKTGLDLRGGARALVEPEQKLSPSELADLIDVTSNRLNVYGITDLTVKPVRDLAGNNFMLIEIAGSTPSELKELISKQGKFEAKIGEEVVFIGGQRDVTSVCRNDAECSGIESCSETREGYLCRFRFLIYLTEEAAKRQADITSKLNVNQTEAGGYLEKKLDLFVDDKLVDSLLISSDLKGRVATTIQIQGSGTGPTREDAFKSAQESMSKLQTILITGSLPYKLKIEKLDTISPMLGQKFIFYILLVGLISMFAVSVIVLTRYRSLKLSLAVLLTAFSEVLILLGVAAFINWNLDLPSIAGILIVIGTGVDQQIIILDESKTRKQEFGISERLKKALFIIIGAYFTSLASLIPLYWAGAGLLRGFAFTTIIGITIGVLITRPAFAEIIKKIEG